MKFSTLNDKQLEILEIVASYIQVNGVSPSLRDIRRKSKTVCSMRGIALQLDVLEETGHITRSSEAKSIEINESFFGSNDELIKIPLFLGTVQAGVPSLFEEHTDDTIPVKLSATKGLRNVYAIKARGESMIDADINDGDYAIVTESISPQDGDIVVALVEGGITIKKFRVIDNHPILFPANKNFKPVSDDFEVRGKLVNVVKPEMLAYFKKLKSMI